MRNRRRHICHDGKKFHFPHGPAVVHCCPPIRPHLIEVASDFNPMKNFVLLVAGTAFALLLSISTLSAAANERVGTTVYNLSYADPRTVEYSDAVDRLETLAESAGGLVTEIDALTPPESLATNHETIRTAVTTAAAAADETLAGLQSTDDGSQRRNAVAAFDTAVSDLQTAVGNARTAAGLGTAPDTTTPDTTPDTSTPDTTGG